MCVCRLSTCHIGICQHVLVNCAYSVFVVSVHSDNEPMFRGSDSTKPKERDVFILSVSFGSSREFAFRPKYGSKTSTVLLEDGDVVTMEGNLQDSHEHIVRQGQGPQASSIRYNLTFRTILRHNRRCSKFS